MEEEESQNLLAAFDEAIGFNAVPMEWIETLRQLSGKSLRGFAKACETTHGHLNNLRSRPSPDMNAWMRRLCLMRKESGLTWSQLGKLWDKTYLDDD